MLDLTSNSLLALSIAAAVTSVLLVMVLALRRTPESLPKRVVHAIPFVVATLFAQVFAVFSTGLLINNTYGFFTSWSDVVGQSGPPVAISTTGLVSVNQGAVRVVDVPRSGGIRDNQVLVWLPPQYGQAAYTNYRFPVVMFMPGSPGQPGTTFAQYRFSNAAMQEVARHHAAPFIGVFPTMTTNPPRDTECTNVAHGPQVTTWLARAVPHYIESHFQAARQGADWTAMGWSTGGFCAAKLMLSYPSLFGSAVSFGGYYTAEQDSTTGNLFGNSTLMLHENSPSWLYQTFGLRGGRLLMISGKQDRSSWTSTQSMLQATYGDSGVSSLIFPTGGHNFANYRFYLPTAIDWAAQSWARHIRSHPRAGHTLNREMRHV